MRLSYLACTAKSNYDKLLALILVATIPLLFFGRNLLPDTEQYKSLWNLGHIPFSMVLVLFIHKRFNLVGWKRGAWLFLIILLASILVELLQALIGREASVYDIARNFIGAGTAWLWIQAPNKIVWLSRGLLLSLLANECLKTANLFYGEYLFVKQLPVISNFENSFDLQRWHGTIELSDDIFSSGKSSLKVTLPPKQYANVQLQGEPQDWSNYETLSFDIYNKQKNNIFLMLRIHDETHILGEYRWRYDDRFNESLLLNAGWNSYELSLVTIENAPARRKIDLKKIANLQFFVLDPERETVLYIDNLRLH